MTLDNYCPLPWEGAYIQTGRVSPCCVFKGNLGTTLSDYQSNPRLEQLRQDFLDGKKPQGCSACWTAEKANIDSIRKHHISRTQDSINLNPTDTTIKFVELRVSNTCNFKCRMCEADSSSLVREETRKNPVLERWYKARSLPSDVSDEQWQEIIEASKNFEGIILTGGEPTLIKRYYELLDHLIAIRRAHKIRLTVFTNAGAFNPVFYDKIKHFTQSMFFLSIDGVGKTAEYQRNGVAWETVEKNIDKILTVKRPVVIHSTLTSLSVLGLLEFNKWLDEKTKNNPEIQFTKFHVTSRPWPMSVFNMHGKYKEKAIEQITETISYIENSHNPKIQSNLRQYRGLLNKVKTSNKSDVDFEYIKLNQILDDIRGQSFEETFGMSLE